MTKPATPPEETPPQAPAPAGDKPQSVKIVNKTPAGPSPREIQLQKEVAYMRDELDGLKGWKAEVDGLFGELLPNRKAVDDTKGKIAGADPASPKGGFLSDLAGFDPFKL